MNPGKTTGDPPAVALRKLLTTYFNDAELQTLANDLGVDYEDLSGDTKTSKAIQLIQTVARRGKTIDLVELCRRERPDIDWNVVGVAVASNPNQFLFVPDESKPLLNASPDRALKIGVALGVLMVLLLGCGFGGGLLAGQVITVTVNPVQPDPLSLQHVQIKVGNKQFTPQLVGVSFADALRALNSLPPGTPVAMQFDNVQATTIADELVKARPNAPISEPHIRFLSTGEVVINMRVNQLGDRRVVLAYTAKVEGGRVILTPTSAWVNVIEVPDTSFGWVPLPQNINDAVTQWAQVQLDAAARSFQFTDVTIQQDSLIIAGITR